MKLEKLKDLRLDYGLTQDQLAKILNISQRTYSHYENGTREIPLDTLIALADYYAVSLDYLTNRTKKRIAFKIKK